jgi:hypothetical protein
MFRRSNRLRAKICSLQNGPVGSSMAHLQLVPREHANPPQFLICEVRLYFVSGAFQASHSRFFRNVPELGFWDPEQIASSRLRHKFRDFRSIHSLSLCVAMALASVSTTIRIVL